MVKRVAPRMTWPQSSLWLTSLWSEYVTHSKATYCSLVSYPARTCLHAKNGLVHQVQILGPVPQNEERPIKLQNDYIITLERNRDVSRAQVNCTSCRGWPSEWESNSWKYRFNWINMVCHVTCSFPSGPSI